MLVLSNMSSTPLFFPKIPSFLELTIFNYSDYCNVCNIYSKHYNKHCTACNKKLCTVKGNIWSEKDQKYICEKCRYKMVKNNKHVTFQLEIN
jgi:hypothetical protein